MRRRNWELSRATGLCDSQGFVEWALESVGTPKAMRGVSFPASPALAPPAFLFPEMSPVPASVSVSLPFPASLSRHRDHLAKKGSEGTTQVRKPGNFSWVRGFPLRLHHTLLTPRSDPLRSSHCTGGCITSVHVIIDHPT